MWNSFDRLILEIILCLDSQVSSLVYNSKYLKLPNRYIISDSYVLGKASSD